MRFVKAMRSQINQTFWLAVTQPYTTSLNAIKNLLDQGADVNIADNNGVTPLLLNIYYNRPDIVSLLLHYGANPDISDNDGCSPIALSLAYRRLDIIQLLFKHGVDIDIVDENGMTFLAKAIKYSDMVIKAVLLTRAEQIATTLNYALKNDEVAILNELMNVGVVNVNVKNKSGDTPLLVAARNGCLAMVKRLLDANANPRLANNYGDTPIFFAVYYQRFDITKTLLATKRININQKNNDKKTVLFSAVENNDLLMVETLLKAGAKVNLLSEDGETPVLIAARQGAVEMLKMLLDAGADVSLANNPEELPIVVVNQPHNRAHKNNQAIVRLLTEAAAAFSLEVLPIPATPMLFSPHHHTMSFQRHDRQRIGYKRKVKS